MSSSLARSAACFLACALAACGPIGATSLIGDAEVALARAHAADGEKLAPYETTLADLYLVKAREEQGHARYSEAKDLAADCIQEANLAAKKAAERRSTSPPAAPASPAAVTPSRPPALVVPLPSPATAPGAAPTAPGAAPERKPAPPVSDAPERKPAPDGGQ